MADEADLAGIAEARLIETGMAISRANLLREQQLHEGEQLGVCIYCHEPCEPTAKLHDYCVEDYNFEQAQLKNQGRSRRS